MNNPEEQQISLIPRNFIERGTFMGGMFKIRNTGAFHGAPQNFIDKAKEVTEAIKSLPAPPENFRAFIIPGSGSQTVVGSWYQVPYGYLEIRKSSANASVSDGNSNYSLQGAEYGIYKGIAVGALLLAGIATVIYFRKKKQK